MFPRDYSHLLLLSTGDSYPAAGFSGVFESRHRHPNPEMPKPPFQGDKTETNTETETETNTETETGTDTTAVDTETTVPCTCTHPDDECRDDVCVRTDFECNSLNSCDDGYECRSGVCRCENDAICGQSCTESQHCSDGRVCHSTSASIHCSAPLTSTATPPKRCACM